MSRKRPTPIDPTGGIAERHYPILFWKTCMLCRYKFINEPMLMCRAERRYYLCSGCAKTERNAEKFFMIISYH